MSASSEGTKVSPTGVAIGAVSFLNTQPLVAGLKEELSLREGGSL